MLFSCMMKIFNKWITRLYLKADLGDKYFVFQYWCTCIKKGLIISTLLDL